MGSRTNVNSTRTHYHPFQWMKQCVIYLSERYDTLVFIRSRWLFVLINSWGKYLARKQNNELCRMKLPRQAIINSLSRYTSDPLQHRSSRYKCVIWPLSVISSHIQFEQALQSIIYSVTELPASSLHSRFTSSSIKTFLVWNKGYDLNLLGMRIPFALSLFDQLFMTHYLGIDLRR